MKKWIREIVQTLNRSIFVGERYERNIRNMLAETYIIIALGLVMFFVNIVIGDYITALSPLAFIILGLLDFYFLKFKRSRRFSVIATSVTIILVMTYDVLFVSNGFAYLWTLLIPLSVCYMFGVKEGIIMSTYFQVLYTVAFYTPVRNYLAESYSEIVLNRFPILYFFNSLITVYVMYQYHKSVLFEIDYTDRLNAEVQEQTKVAVERAKRLEELRDIQIEKEAAERANESKSAFLANMSHEIRTPINAVLGMNEMIMRESLRAKDMPDDELRGAMHQISVYSSDVESAGNNLLSIINDILDFSKIEAGRMSITEAPYQLSSVLNDMSNMFLLKARNKGLRYIVDVDGTIPNELYGDEVRVRQIITNLLSNAVKYTEKGSVRLALRGQIDGKAEKGKLFQLVVTVQDTGIGIRQEDAEKLFTKFERLDLQHNSTVEGTGLGLGIVKSLLEMMGGEISVQSEYGKGSTFTARIPQKIVSEEPIGDFQNRFELSTLESKAYRESFHAPDAHILIVDDTRMNLTVLINLLKNTQVGIDTAGSGQEAVDLAHRNAYDLIFMDQRMPEMDGIEAMRRIRGDLNGRNCDTPVVCLTADAVIGAKERYLSEGFSDYLTKPVDSRALEKMLIKYLPGEKVTVIGREREQQKPPAAPEDDSFALLRQADIDPQTALTYCQNDEALYDTLLREFAQGEEEKAAGMARAFAARDWKNYAVLVHSLKSSAKMIGAAELSQSAARLEAAADSGDEETLRRGHDEMMTRYAATVRAIRERTDRAAAENTIEPDFCDNGVLEFLPENE